GAPALTDAGLAGVVVGARVGVVAGRPGPRGIGRAHPGRRVAGALVVALVGHRTHDGVRSGAHAGLAGVGLRAGIGVVAGRAIALGQAGGALPTHRIAGARIVALVERSADDRSDVAAARQTAVGLYAQERRRFVVLGIGVAVGRDVDDVLKS